LREVFSLLKSRRWRSIAALKNCRSTAIVASRSAQGCCYCCCRRLWLSIRSCQRKCLQTPGINARVLLEQRRFASGTRGLMSVRRIHCTKFEWKLFLIKTKSTLLTTILIRSKFQTRSTIKLLIKWCNICLNP
jgi:hypothetical protein